MPKDRKKKSNEVRNERRRKKRYEDMLNSTKPPRPPNRFILYRTHKQTEYNQNPNILHQRLKNRDPNSPSPVGMRELSTVISEDWANEPSHVKEEWDRIAEQIKLTPPYNKNFEAISELKYELNSTEFGTFVNATSANSRQSFQQTKIVSVNFVLEHPYHTPLESESPIQTSEDDTDDIPTTLLNGLSIDEPSLEPFKFDQPIEFIDPRIMMNYSNVSNVDDVNFFTGEPMFSSMYMWEPENFFESESPFSTQSESPFLTPTEDTDSYLWEH